MPAKIIHLPQRSKSDWINPSCCDECRKLYAEFVATQPKGEKK